MSEWYVRTMGEEIGPLTSNELLDYVRRGKVFPDTDVRRNASSWRRAEEIQGLFERASANEARRACPHCGHRLQTTPTVCPGCRQTISESVLLGGEDVYGGAGNVKRSLADRMWVVLSSFWSR